MVRDVLQLQTYMMTNLHAMVSQWSRINAPDTDIAEAVIKTMATMLLLSVASNLNTPVQTMHQIQAAVDRLCEVAEGELTC